MTAADLPNKTLHYSSQYRASQGLLNSLPDGNVTDKENMCTSRSQYGQGDEPKQETSKTSKMSIFSECNAHKNGTVHVDENLECTEDKMTERKNPLDMLQINDISQKDDTNVNGGNKASQKKKRAGDKRHTCGLCGYSTNNNCHLQRHMMRHTGDKPYKCNVCGDCFKLKQNLQGHQRTHTGDRPYRCNVCGDSFKFKQHLRRHQRRHTGDKPYRCDMCGYSASQMITLKRHQRTHTADKPYKCDQCEYSANQMGNLKAHKRTHTGEKPYRCDECGYSTTRTSHLKNHQRIHTDDKPYKCDMCGYSTRWFGDLKKHQKKHAQDWRSTFIESVLYSIRKQGNLFYHNNLFWNIIKQVFTLFVTWKVMQIALPYIFYVGLRCTPCTIINSGTLKFCPRSFILAWKSLMSRYHSIGQRASLC